MSLIIIIITVIIINSVIDLVCMYKHRESKATCCRDDLTLIRVYKPKKYDFTAVQIKNMSHC